MLNDNEMSISPSVGALSKYLSEIKLSQAWQQGKGAWDTVTEHVPVVGPRLLEMSRRFRQSVVSFAQPGPAVRGSRASPTSASCPATTAPLLEETFRRALALNGPVIVHVRTQKGKGYKPAETDQVSFHGAALPPMAIAPTADTHDRIGRGASNGDAMASSAAGGASLTASRDVRRGRPAVGVGHGRPPHPRAGAGARRRGPGDRARRAPR